MQNGADIFRNYIIIRNRQFSPDHVVKMKPEDWSTFIPRFLHN